LAPLTFQHIYILGPAGRSTKPPLHHPLFACAVAAGFPTPADDYVEQELDLDLREHLIHHPAATFYVRAQGDSMRGVGIFSGDRLVVDRALTAADGSVIIAVLDGQVVCKTLRLRTGGQPALEAANPTYRPIVIEEGQDFEVWGVVTAVVHTLT